MDFHKRQDGFGLCCSSEGDNQQQQLEGQVFMVPDSFSMDSPQLELGTEKQRGNRRRCEVEISESGGFMYATGNTECTASDQSQFDEEGFYAVLSGIEEGTFKS